MIGFSQQELFDTLPVAVYGCLAPYGYLYFRNRKAVELWGTDPALYSFDQRFCGSFRLWRLDGTLLPHDECPMAVSLREGTAYKNAEVIIERPDHSRLTVVVNIKPVFNDRGRVAAAINVFHER